MPRSYNLTSVDPIYVKLPENNSQLIPELNDEVIRVFEEIEPHLYQKVIYNF